MCTHKFQYKNKSRLRDNRSGNMDEEKVGYCQQEKGHAGNEYILIWKHGFLTRKR